VRKLSGVMSNVLLVGDSGTGKELFAKAIHYNGVTRNKPFVPVNCGSIPDTLIESELFGHRRGAFTGAVRDKIGFFESANGGTLFLDEISTLPIGVQSTLLRVLEERAVVPVGDTRPRPVELRVIAASNRDLDEMVRSGEFREDLFFRLNVVPLILPPLRERRGDIPLLVQHFLDRYTAQMNKQVKGITNGAMRALLSQEALQQFERQHIIYSLRRHNYDKAETARQLGIGISSLYRKLDELNIPKNLGEAEREPKPAESE
jgi:two-component system response regulator AtoC